MLCVIKIKKKVELIINSICLTRNSVLVYEGKRREVIDSSSNSNNSDEMRWEMISYHMIWYDMLVWYKKHHDGVGVKER